MTDIENEENQQLQQLATEINARTDFRLQQFSRAFEFIGEGLGHSSKNFYELFTLPSELQKPQQDITDSSK